MLSALLILPLVSGAAAAAAAPQIAPERQVALEHMVVQDCGSCHGLTMRGGLGSPITPADLAGRNPEGLAEIILDGIPGTAMPPWRPLLTEDEARWIADYLLTVKEDRP
ncbi:MAG: cytochrome c [Paracoccus sp. (in: a-proteobacteria)]|uniref:c-type cytochrome n=1 Tax=Paracoccus sp. TaxID=267 RepID=UPI0026E00A5A|nr:cytochrome c [Paracoccus sp. (in: a-proteobacteria)]MDO5614417.1 cytochrome c [Paracoccus sp. (in: a-proteobacteria)]